MAPHGLMFSQIEAKHFHKAFYAIPMAPGHHFQPKFVKQSPPLENITQSYVNIGEFFVFLGSISNGKDELHLFGPFAITVRLI